MDLLERVQHRATKMVKRRVEGLREQGLLSLEKRRLRGYLTNVYKYLVGGNAEEEPRLSKRQGAQIEHMEFRVNTGKHFCEGGRTLEHVAQPREVVEPSSSEVFKTQLDTVLGNLL